MKDMKKVIFSFIIPLYNCADYIIEGVNSIIGMGRDDYEIILVDDGSKDYTEEVCKQLVEEYDQIIYLYQDNRGVSSARNNGTKEAKGEYVIFLDVDDTIDSIKMNELLDNILQFPDINIAIFGMSFDYYYRTQRYRREELIPPLVGDVGSEKWRLRVKELFETNSISSMCNKVIKKTALIDNNLQFREDMFFYEDLELSIRLLAKCDKVLFSDKVIYNYRQVEDEGNAGRRLLKIPNISDLAYKIEMAMDFFIKQQDGDTIRKQLDDVLVSLYMIWVREKICVSSVKEIAHIQDDFSEWINNHEFDLNDVQVKRALKICNTNPLYFKVSNRYYYLRHKIAIFLKSKGML